MTIEEIVLSTPHDCHLHEACQVSQCSPASLNHSVFLGNKKDTFGIIVIFTGLKRHRKKNLTLSEVPFIHEPWTLSVNYHFPVVTVREKVQVSRAEVESRYLPALKLSAETHDGDFDLFFIFTRHQLLGNIWVILSNF